MTKPRNLSRRNFYMKRRGNSNGFAGLQRFIKIEFANIYAVFQQFPACPFIVHLEIKAVNVSAFIRLCIIKFCIAVFYQLFCERSSIVLISVSPQVHINKGKRSGGVVFINQCFIRCQLIFYIIKLHIDGIIYLLLKILLPIK